MDIIHFNRMKKHVLLILWVLVAACQGKPAYIPVVDAALNDTISFFIQTFRLTRH
jgi:hypothetical protein